MTAKHFSKPKNVGMNDSWSNAQLNYWEYVGGLAIGGVQFVVCVSKTFTKNASHSTIRTYIHPLICRVEDLVLYIAAPDADVNEETQMKQMYSFMFFIFK